MKKNNVFLLSYIAFVLVCIIAYSCGGFERWRSVVASIAIASACLAYADFYAVYSNAYGFTCNEAEPLLVAQKNQIQEDKQIVLSNTIVISILKINNICVVENENKIEEISAAHREIENKIHIIEKRTARKRKLQKRYTRFSEGLTFLAFFAFVCILTFLPLADFAAAAQDYISVMGFFAVLTSQYAIGVFEDALRNEKKCLEDVIVEQKCTHKKLLDIQSEIVLLQEDIKKGNKEE